MTGVLLTEDQRPAVGPPSAASASAGLLVASTVSSSLARAVRGDGLHVEFQPIVDVQRNAVRGYEALARIALEPLAPPDVWFHRATEAGVVAELDATVTRMAIAQRPHLPPGCFLTINVEPSSLVTPEWQAAVAEAGDLAGMVFELTEHRPADPDALAGVMRRLRASGARFALDDTGSGYAGLGQLLWLRPEFLKIDRSLVADIDRDEAKVAVIEMLGTFGSRLGAWLIAEGVERPSEAAALQRLAVPLAQGFVYSRPGRGFRTVDASHLATGPCADDESPLTSLVEPVATVPITDVGNARVAPTRPSPAAGRYGVVVGVGRRPRWIVDHGSGRVVECQIVTNHHSTPGEIAARLATRSDIDHNLPVVVIDDHGALVGIITTTRLLAALGSA